MAYIAESLLKKIFGDRAGEYATDPDFLDYFRQLSTLSGDRLGQEPDRLVEERASLQEETENLAYSNYKTFIQAANCSKEIYDDFTLIDGNVDRLLEKMPNISEQCEKFLSEARKINSRRAGNSTALQKHSQVLEILEIPQVMDTCVRAGYHEEALALTQYATKLERRLGYIPIVKSIATEVSRQRELLLENLVEQLHTSLTLSQCLKVVGFLRRLNEFTEAELRTLFLEARNGWFDNLLAAIARDDAYQHITKVMELSRVHLFDVITHFRAAFPDDDPFLVSGFSTGSGGPIGNEETLTCNLPAIFHGWILERVEKFLEILTTDLALLTKNQSSISRLDSVMAQCMYFGLSFGRVGADFRELTIAIFENAIWNFFMENVDKAYDRLSQDLTRSRFLEIFTDRSNRTQYTSLLATETDPTSNTDSTGAESQASALHPPLSLLEFLPLASYCNTVLSTFNDLRTCFPVTLASRVASKLQTNMENAAQLLLDLKKDFNEDSKMVNSIDHVTTLLIDILAPYLNSCLEVLFPSKQLAGILGVNMAEFSQMVYLARIDLDELNVLVKGKVNRPNLNVISEGDEPDENVVSEEERKEDVPDTSVDVNVKQENNEEQIDVGQAQVTENAEGKESEA